MREDCEGAERNGECGHDDVAGDGLGYGDGDGDGDVDGDNNGAGNSDGGAGDSDSGCGFGTALICWERWWSLLEDRRIVLHEGVLKASNIHGSQC